MIKLQNFLFLMSLGTLCLLGSCDTPKEQSEESSADPRSKASAYTLPRVPDWHKNAAIYEVNLRHYSPEGTFKAFEAHIPRLKEMGVDILWFMPIHPISQKKRKGDLGSPYAVADYYATNPDYGSLADFQSLLDKIHAAGMYCILDWVPNHSGWDNPWIVEHKNWYTQDSLGNVLDPINPETGRSWGWTDVADFNYDQVEMREGMIEAMKFWVKDIGIDGFRVDVAHSVPVDFWAQCRDSLYAIKPLFMLAEAEVPAIRNNNTFVMDYGWSMHHLLNEIAQSQGAVTQKSEKLLQGNKVEGQEEKKVSKNALDIDRQLAKNKALYSQGYQMHFTSNHDENAWSGTEFERMGDAHKAFAVLVFTFDGMPLIYSGQESALDKRLAFFTKDEIEWGDYAYADFYKSLLDLKHRNQALWNGKHGGELVKIPSGKDEYIYAFQREKEGDKVLVILNLSSQKQDFTLQSAALNDTYKDVFGGSNEIKIEREHSLSLAPWGYQVYSTQ